jgi:predicted permease
MDALLNDLRYAMRTLVRSPGFTTVAVLTLALAIGATTAIYSVVDGVLLRPLPFRDPQALVRIESTENDGRPTPVSPLDLIDYRDQSHSFAAVVPIKEHESVRLTRKEGPAMRLMEAKVGAQFWSMLGETPEIGRVWAPDADSPNASRVVILSDELWRSEFGADPRVVGSTITLNGKPTTIVAVARPSFHFPSKPDLWEPYVWAKYEIEPDNRGLHEIYAIGRLAPGATVESAQRDLSAIAARLAQQYPQSNTGHSASVRALQPTIVGDLRAPLFAMLGAVAFVLLIACTNVANLLLVRAAGRDAEIAVRTALGAGRLRLVRQLVTESVILAVAGGALGTLIASWVVVALSRFGPSDLPRLDEIAIDGRVLAVTAAITIGTGLLFGLLPALQSSRPDIATMLRSSSRGATRGGATRTRALLVVTEMALAVVLLAGAGLLIRSLVALLHVDPGFRAEQVVTFDVTLSDKYRYDHSRRDYATKAIDRLSRVPGAKAVAVASSRPVATDAPFDVSTSVNFSDRPTAQPGHEYETGVQSVSPDYFRALAIPVVQGRLFDETENRPDVSPVVVVNQEFARRYFGRRSPLGTSIILGLSHDTASSPSDSLRSRGEIVGVVADVKQQTLADKAYPEVYVPFNTLPYGISIIVRSTAAPAVVESAIRGAMREIDPDSPIYHLTTMRDAISDSVARPRFYAGLLGAFAGVALLLAALGIYGVISYSVAQRTRELGIRIALGATGAQISRLVLGGGLRLTVVGVVVGVIAAMGLTRLLASLLFGVQPLDPPTFAMVTIVLLGAATLATWLPARRASATQPSTVLRD